MSDMASIDAKWVDSLRFDAINGETMTPEPKVA